MRNRQVSRKARNFCAKPEIFSTETHSYRKLARGNTPAAGGSARRDGIGRRGPDLSKGIGGFGGSEREDAMADGQGGGALLFLCLLGERRVLQSSRASTPPAELRQGGSSLQSTAGSTSTVTNCRCPLLLPHAGGARTGTAADAHSAVSRRPCRRPCRRRLIEVSNSNCSSHAILFIVRAPSDIFLSAFSILACLLWMQMNSANISFFMELKKIVCLNEEAGVKPRLSRRRCSLFRV